MINVSYQTLLKISAIVPQWHNPLHVHVNKCHPVYLCYYGVSEKMWQSRCYMYINQLLDSVSANQTTVFQNFASYLTTSQIINLSKLNLIGPSTLTSAGDLNKVRTWLVPQTKCGTTFLGKWVWSVSHIHWMTLAQANFLLFLYY